MTEHYYDNHGYTSKQAAHANQVLAGLMKRRFFLKTSESNPGEDFCLNPRVFGKVIDLENSLRSAYLDANATAKKMIQEKEKLLGIDPVNLDNNRQLVICNRYGAGFEICRAYPLVEFAKYAPRTLGELEEEHYKLFIGSKAEDDISPKDLRSYKQNAAAVARQIWEELDQLEIWNTDNHRCVVIFESKFNCSGRDQNNDFAKSLFADMQKTPFAVGYLFWKYSLVTRIVPGNHVVFSTSRGSHVNVQHWAEYGKMEIPSIRYSYKGGYDCPVLFVTVL